jgi:hypothetical protein
MLHSLILKLQLMKHNLKLYYLPIRISFGDDELLSYL